MINSLVKDKVGYKVFDYNFKESSHIYSLHIANFHNKVEEAIHNQQLIKSTYNVDELVILKQIHSNIVIDVDMMQDYAQELEGDGLVTTKKNIILSIYTSDCVPVLFADIEGKVIGAAHCGWRGAKSNIIRMVVEKMKLKAVKDFIVFIGPCIKQPSYEVREDFYKDFLNDSFAYSQFFIKGVHPGQYFFNLFGFVKEKLRESGIENIIFSEDDTYLQPHNYPSYRYKQHNGINNPSSILSTIMLK